jgi:hypothetical protein
VFPLFATGVADTSGKFAAGVVDTGDELPPVSLIPVAPLDFQISPQIVEFSNFLLTPLKMLTVKLFWLVFCLFETPKLAASV